MYLLPSILILSIMVLVMVLIFIINRDYDNLEKCQDDKLMKQIMFNIHMKNVMWVFSGLFWVIFLITGLS